MTVPPLPVVEVAQPDGPVRLDFSARGPFGDFAFEAHFPDGRSQRFGAYHTEESSLFFELLAHWVRTVPPEKAVGQLGTLRRAVRRATRNAEATTAAEDSFAGWLPMIAALGSRTPPPEDIDYADEAGRVMRFSPGPDEVRLTTPGAPPATVKIPANQIWQVVAAMMWRSYRHRGWLLSRLSTLEYEQAIDTFETAVRSADGMAST